MPPAPALVQLHFQTFGFFDELLYDSGFAVRCGMFAAEVILMLSSDLPASLVVNSVDLITNRNHSEGLFPEFRPRIGCAPPQNGEFTVP
jgi:hypothetical protein